MMFTTSQAVLTVATGFLFLMLVRPTLALRDPPAVPERSIRCRAQMCREKSFAWKRTSTATLEKIKNLSGIVPPSNGRTHRRPSISKQQRSTHELLKRSCLKDFTPVSAIEAMRATWERKVAQGTNHLSRLRARGPPRARRQSTTIPVRHPAPTCTLPTRSARTWPRRTCGKGRTTYARSLRVSAKARQPQREGSIKTSDTKPRFPPRRESGHAAPKFLRRSSMKLPPNGERRISVPRRPTPPRITHPFNRRPSGKWPPTSPRKSPTAAVSPAPRGPVHTPVPARR